MTPNPSEIALLQEYPQASKIYLGVEKGVTLLTARADGTQAQGAVDILLKDVVFDPTFLRAGLTVAIHGVEANDRRVDAMFVSYDSGTQIMRIGANAVTAEDNQFVTVFTARKLWKIPEPAWDGSQHTLPFPIAGPDRMGFTGEPLAFVGKDTYHPLGRAIVEWHWAQLGGVVVGGDIDAANTPESPLRVQWDTPGEYIIRLQAIDEDGEINYSLRTILIFNRPVGTNTNTPYDHVVFNALPKFTGTGWNCNVTVYGVGDHSEFPPQAKVIIRKEDYYGRQQLNIGGPYRGLGEIFFCGYIKGSSIVSDADARTVTFELETVDVLLRALEMDDFTFRSVDTPVIWRQFNSYTVAMGLCYLLQFRTTLDSICDVFLSLLDYRLDLQDVPSAKLFDQINQSLLSTCFGYSAGSRYGSITFARQRNMITAEERGLFNLAEITLSPADWLSITVASEQLAGVAQVILEGQDALGFPIRAVYPAVGPAHNGEIQRKSGLLFLDQTQADEMAAQLWRNGNRKFTHVSIDLPTYAIPEPAFQSYFAVQLPVAYNNAGINWVNGSHGIDGKEFYCVGMSFNGGDGYMTVRIEGEKSVYADDGDPWVFPDPVPVLQHMYGYDQDYEGGAAESGLTDDAETLLTDDLGDILEDDSV